MVLGANPAEVLRNVLRQGAGLALAGLALGLTAAVGLMRLLAGLLYQLSPTDPPVYIAVSLLLTVIALAATYLPARRASRVEPVIALRYE